MCEEFQRKWPLDKKERPESPFFTINPASDEYTGQYQDKFGQTKEKKLTLQVEVQEQENGYLIFLKGEMKPTEPKFELQAEIDANHGVCARIDLPQSNEILTIYQHKCWWTRPAFPKSFADVPDNSQLVLLKYKKQYVCMLAVCSEIYRGDLEGTENGLMIRLSSNCSGLNVVDALALSVVYGENPYDCIKMAGENALKALGHPEMLRENRKYPAIFERLGWCSWDAFYQEVNENGLLEKAKEWKEKKIPIGWALIDDGWLDADLDTQLLTGIDADKKRFPHGLRNVVKHLKQETGVPYVGVWHAVMGYWNGVKKNSEADHFFIGTTDTLSDGRIIPKTEVGSAFAFYDRWHQYLKSMCGIDFIKVDGQSSISIFHSGKESYGEASGGLQKGLNASAALHFDNAIINCMGMGAEDVWHRPSSMITRTSDDFVPSIEHGFREHAIQNAYSSLWTGLFYVGDWDMFFSRHPENRQNGILRAISGGPVYTSDKVGQTDLDFIRPLILENGTVLRCESIGLPTEDSLFKDPTEDGKMLKIYNRKNDAWYVAAFNIRKDGKSVKGKINLTDIPELIEDRYLLYDEVKNCSAILSTEQSYSLSLGPDEAAVYEIVPEREIQVYGIRGKYIIGGTVEKISEVLERVIVRILEDGDLVYLSKRDTCMVRKNDEEIEIKKTGSVMQITGCKVGDIIEICS